MYQDRNCRAGKVRSPCLRIFALVVPLAWKAFPPGGLKACPHLLQTSNTTLIFLWSFSLPGIPFHSHCWSCQQMHAQKAGTLELFTFVALAVSQGLAHSKCLLTT